MKNSEVSIRNAEPTREDGEAYARFVDMASEGGIRKALGRRYFDIIATAFVEPDHDLSFQRAVFAQSDGSIVGMASARTAKEHKRSTNEPLKEAPGSRFRRAMGMAMLGFFHSILEKPREEDYYLEFIAVSDDARGKGIGSELLGFMERRARERNARRLTLDVSGKNPGAIRLYERYGFSITGRWPTAHFLPAMVYRMAKVFASS